MADISDDQIQREKTKGRVLLVVSVIALLIGIGGFGTASSGDVEMFGVTLDAKYACFIYFLLGALCVWSATAARQRGFK